MAVPAEWWPWLLIMGLGLFHGLNPAMGWLFAVALGLHRGRRETVLVSLVPIAAGHAAAVAVVLIGVLVLGVMVDHGSVNRITGAILIGWAAWHMLYGHRQRIRIGMQTGLLGLLAWSFLMATAHGAGLMVIPALQPLCGSTTALSAADGSAAAVALAALGVHSAAMLAATATASLTVYNWIGVDFLRRGWVNVDLIWIGALAVCGAVLLVT
jgi:hypothetical protein